MSYPRVIVWDAQGRAYAIPANTDFMPVVMAGYYAPLPPVEEHPAQENGPTDEDVEEAGAAFVAHVEALDWAKEIVANYGDDFDLDALKKRIIDNLKEAIATDNAGMLNEALQDWEALEKEDEENEEEEDQMAEVARYLHEDEEAQEALALENKKKEEAAQKALAFQIKMDEIYKKIQEMTALNQEHKTLDKQLYIMRQVKDRNTRNANNKTYEMMDAADKAALTAWLEKYAEFTALFAECKAVDPNFRKTFNAYIKARLPAEPERNYEGLNAHIARNNLAALNRKPAAGKSAPATNTPTYTIADYAAPVLTSPELRVPPLSALKSDPAVSGDE